MSPPLGGEATVSGVGAILKEMWLDLSLRPVQRSRDLLREVFLLLLGLGERVLGEILESEDLDCLDFDEGVLIDGLISSIWLESFLSLFLEGLKSLSFPGD